MKTPQFLDSLSALGADITYVDARGNLEARIPLDEKQSLSIRVKRFRGSTTDDPLFVGVTNLHYADVAPNPRMDYFLFSGHAVDLQDLVDGIRREVEHGQAYEKYVPKNTRIALAA